MEPMAFLTPMCEHDTVVHQIVDALQFPSPRVLKYLLDFTCYGRAAAHKRPGTAIGCVSCRGRTPGRRPVGCCKYVNGTCFNWRRRANTSVSFKY